MSCDGIDHATLLADSTASATKPASNNHTTIMAERYAPSTVR